jgi:membrane protease YdiL (CAAX protease family)
MTRSRPTEPERPAGTEPRQTAARRGPVATFVLLAFAIGWPALAAPAITGLPSAPFLLIFLYCALLGPALLVTRWANGPGAVRRLLSRVLIWRFGVIRWAVILLGMPVLTVALAAASGTLRSPEDGWAVEAGWYLFNTLIYGVLLANLWEETAWGGLVQSRLMARHGLLIGSLLTAPLFAGIHVPMQFEPGWTWSGVAVGLALLFAMAPFYRYLLGMHLLDTGGSILAIAVQHAAWNEAQKLDAVRGEWQVVAAVLLLTLLVAVGRRLWQPQSHPMGRDAEQAAAAQWTTPTRTPRFRD